MYFELRQSSHQGFVNNYRTVLHKDNVDIQEYKHIAEPIMRRLFESSKIVRQRIEVCFNILFIKFIHAADELRETFYLSSRRKRKLSNQFIDDGLNRCFQKILVYFENFIQNGRFYTSGLQICTRVLFTTCWEAVAVKFNYRPN